MQSPVSSTLSWCFTLTDSMRPKYCPNCSRRSKLVRLTWCLAPAWPMAATHSRAECRNINSSATRSSRGWKTGSPGCVSLNSTQDTACTVVRHWSKFRFAKIRTSGTSIQTSWSSFMRRGCAFANGRFRLTMVMKSVTWTESSMRSTAWKPRWRTGYTRPNWCMSRNTISTESTTPTSVTIHTAVTHKFWNGSSARDRMKCWK